SVATSATCCGEGEEGSFWTSLFNFDTDVSMAPVSVGKSLLAEPTSFVALPSTFCSCDRNSLRPPLWATLTFPMSLTAFSRSVRSEQYAGLLLPPQPLNATARAATAARAWLRAGRIGLVGLRIHDEPVQDRDVDGEDR